MTYVVLSVVALAIIAAATLPVLKRVDRRPLLLTALVLLVLTVVFDNIIVGVGLVAYDESLISGVLMPIAPVEDLAYAIGAVMLVPALWILFGRRRDGHAGAAASDESDREPQP
ncbi:lycopene cyclase domain-containing protein [Demequina muriae]|uniref:Lycopene cyclase domain-containing protein n=1 Tax=Demequina muriae TaxID=3051664 RepID=A0ABT8GGI1_9MICO|nr:lycopene cyclase domain-containing protein [Demequina sp. EGI L300058]MDN4480535.1 lycopene cyclase domain-containing protein [Demequina sp. EGI L300058]